MLTVETLMADFPLAELTVTLGRLFAPPPKVALEANRPEPKRRFTGRVTRQSAQRIICNRAHNPYRPFTKAYATYTLFQRSSTVGAARAEAALTPDAFDLGYLRYASRDGYITLEDA